MELEEMNYFWPTENQIDWQDSFSFTKKMFEEADIKTQIIYEIDRL